MNRKLLIAKNKQHACAFENIGDPTSTATYLVPDSHLTRPRVILLTCPSPRGQILTRRAIPPSTRLSFTSSSLRVGMASCMETTQVSLLVALTFKPLVP